MLLSVSSQNSHNSLQKCAQIAQQFTSALSTYHWHRKVCFGIRRLRDLRCSQWCVNWSQLVLNGACTYCLAVKFNFLLTHLNGTLKISAKFDTRQVWPQVLQTLGSSRKIIERCLKQANFQHSSRCVHNGQLQKWASSSAVRECMFFTQLRFDQGTAEKIFIEFDTDEFHQHLPAYSKVHVVYPNIWVLGINIIIT